jgi:crossover junction endodeoxyribonuclease RusA
VKPFELTLVIPGLPESINSIGRKHFMVKTAESKKWRTYVVFESKGKALPPTPLAKAKLTFTRVSKRQMDFDNLVSSFKAVQDGLVDAGIIINDTPRVIGTPTYLWEKCLGNNAFIKIKIEGEI